jgi:alpha-ketoglutarate-dependent taurine dioxygenase
MATITPLEANFGAAVRDIDLRQQTSPEEAKQLVDGLYENRLLIIKDQDLREADYLRFGKLWGAPIPHVLDHMRLQGFPEMMAVGNTEEKDRVDAVRLGAALWHTDQSYEQVPASATMLYSIVVPKQGGQTRFANMAAAYDALDDEMKQRIDSYVVSHLYGAAKLTKDEYIASPLIKQSQTDHVPPCKHPLVLRHPVTGRKALYGVGQSCFAIDGVEDEEARQLLWDLRDHAVQPKFIYEHGYQVGDIAIFDTFSTMHCAKHIDIADSVEDDHARLLWRISVRGMPAACAHLAA